ncbi:SAM-dependent methyltransferase [Actinomadura chibensis]|uniref:SAM-dependent methyltransferase n=1 Tax=Actinomadura chibensis TaxID=392828 RepID=A0A5D0NX16_9ACTN|nr:SAM-dependent methyltransferase [Actinomadura chibensis]TYB48995.1 SAM-dependent methyltransferase [Actinomadura chibensis]
MTGDEQFWDEAEKDLTAGIDTSVPHSARIWNYWMGGKDNYPVDQEAGDQFAAIYPGIVDMARTSRYFIARMVRFLAEDLRMRQFLDIGTGLPSHDNTHEVAHRAAPDARVVYVDNDPLVLVHARALLTGAHGEATDYIDADLRDPKAILEKARAKLNFEQPIALMLMGVLGHLPIEDDDRYALGIVEELKEALPPGSYLALYDGTNTSMAYVEAIRLYNEGGSLPYYLRSPEQLDQYFEGFERLEPGLVQIQRWNPDTPPLAEAGEIDAWGGLARKP